MDNPSDEIKQLIQTLPKDNALLFATLNSEKMLPGYKFFFETEKWGNYDFFEKLIDQLYTDFIKIDDVNYELLLNELETYFPDLENFESTLASFGFDSAIAFNQLVLFRTTNNISHVINNSQTCMDTVDMFVQIKNNIKIIRAEDVAALNEMIENDPVMQNEFKRQMALLSELSPVASIDDDLITRLRNLNRSFGTIVDFDLVK